MNDGIKVGNAPPSKSVFSPSLIATVNIKQNLQLRAFYKDIFRYPTLSDQYYYTPQPRLVEPEYVKQYNIGAVYVKHFDKLVNYLILTADAYYNDVTNKIIYLPGRSAEIPSVRNLGAVDIRGVDVTAKVELKPSYKWRVNLSGSYTFQKSLDVTNPDDRYYLEQIPYTPVHNANFNTSVNYKKIGLNYNFSYSSARYYTSNNTPQYYIAPYKLSDISAIYNFSAFKMPVMASAEVNNLFNERYEVVRYYPMPQRSVRFTLQITI
ncbi:MAG: TonB-dependent receptor [Sphingobacteriaceae bacterium]|nr:MAG: TonB-dependent receptor [Sphingobacteriaceae bacterium]